MNYHLKPEKPLMHHLIRLGRKRLICGKAANSTRLINSTIAKGVMPRKASPIGTLVTPLTTKTFIPIGGVMTPNSPSTAISIPRCTGSKPRATRGPKIMGIVRGPLGINFGTYFRYLSGGRYTRSIRSQDLGLSLYQGNQTIFAESRGSHEYPGLYIWDIKLEKEFRIRSTRFAVFCDVFNVLNQNKEWLVYSISSNPNIDFQEIEGIQDPRIG